MSSLKNNRRNRFFFASLASVALALALGVVLAGRSAETAANDEADIRAVIAQHVKARETGDVALAEKLWAHDDASTVAEGGSFNYGWTEFRDHHLRPEFEAMKNVKFAVEDIKIHIKGAMAWTTFSYKISGEYKGRAFDNTGAATMVLEKRGRDWLIVHEHTSTKRRPAPTPAPVAKPQ